MVSQIFILIWLLHSINLSIGLDVIGKPVQEPRILVTDRLAPGDTFSFGITNNDRIIEEVTQIPKPRVIKRVTNVNPTVLVNHVPSRSSIVIQNEPSVIVVPRTDPLLGTTEPPEDVNDISVSPFYRRIANIWLFVVLCLAALFLVVILILTVIAICI